MKRLFALLSLLACIAPAQAFNVFATVPEWGALAKEIGGNQATVFTATNGLQDPHRVEARPSLIAQARRADLVIATGAELEIGWLPVVLRESGNGKVQPGLPGHFEAARYVAMLEIPSRLDRADGDVHAAGNPHIQTDPRHFLKIGEALASRMAELDPANAAVYQGNYKAFAAKWRSAIARWEAQAAPLKGVNVVVQHSSFTYLLNWLGLKQLATLEPKPGLEPSAAYLGEVLGRVKAQAPRFVLRAAYNSPRPAEWFSEQAHVPVAVLPFTVGGDAAANDLFGLFDDTVQRLLKAAKP